MDGECYRLIAGAGLEPILAPHLFGGSKASGFIQAMMAENKTKHTGQYRNPSDPAHEDNRVKRMVTWEPFDYKKLANADQDGDNNARYGASPFIQKHFKGEPVPFVTRENRLRQGDVNAEVPGETPEQREARLRAQAQKFLAKAEELAGIQKGKVSAATKIQKVFRKSQGRKNQGRPTFFKEYITYEKMKPFIDLYFKGEGKYTGGFLAPRYLQRGNSCDEIMRNNKDGWDTTGLSFKSGLKTDTINPRGHRDYRDGYALDVRENTFTVKEAAVGGMKELPASVILEASAPHLREGGGIRGWYYESHGDAPIPISLKIKFKSPEGPQPKKFSESSKYNKKDFEGPLEYTTTMASMGRYSYRPTFKREEFQKAEREYNKNPEYTEAEPGLNPTFHEGAAIELSLKAMKDTYRKYRIGELAARIYESRRIHQLYVEAHKESEKSRGWSMGSPRKYAPPTLDDIVTDASYIYQNLRAVGSQPKVVVTMNGAEYVYGTTAGKRLDKWDWYDGERKKLDAEEKGLPLWGDEKSRKKREEINQARKALSKKADRWAEDHADEIIDGKWRPGKEEEEDSSDEEEQQGSNSSSSNSSSSSSSSSSRKRA